MDEPESMGAIGMAGRERLDNLIFVVNCNLQRLDGPVRGNGKIIQELESDFRGSGWNVIKVIWGRHWDPLFARDKKGILMRRMMECVDGEYQTFKSKDGAYVREYFFNTPELKELVADYSDDDIWKLNRGGHDPFKVYNAYHAAVNHRDQPTVILAKTIKGYGMGVSGEAQNITHQQKKMSHDSIRSFRDRFHIQVADEALGEVPYVTFAKDSPEFRYMEDKRLELGGYLPMRRGKAAPLAVPELAVFERFLKSTEDREISTTMAFVQILHTLLRDKNVGKHIVPIVPDESRTFGMEGLFRQLGIWNQLGQLYTPQDADQLMFYKESKGGQILQEGINEPGAMCDWMAAATSYSTHGVPMIPFYIFYSMFGFQRVGDLAWAAGDMRARGFLLGGTAGRTTLNGEGLQHEDGHSHVYAATIPNCISYDPTFGYEVAVIVQDGLRRMYAEQQDVYYYLTVMNENYLHPAMPEGAAPGHHQGHVPVSRRRPGQAESAARAVAGLRDDPARGDRRRRPAESRLGRRRRSVELPQFHRARARRHAGRPREHAQPDGESQAVACRGEPRVHRGSGHRSHRLCPRLRRTDPSPCSPALHRARHGWLRALGHTRKAARILRGRPALCGHRRAEGAGRRRIAPRGEGRGSAAAIRDRSGQAGAMDGVRGDR